MHRAPAAKEALGIKHRVHTLKSPPIKAVDGAPTSPHRAREELGLPGQREGRYFSAFESLLFLSEVNEKGNLVLRDFFLKKTEFILNGLI